MGAHRFATTRMRGLVAAGKAEDLQHGLLTALLTRHLGPEYGALFAEFEARDSDARDWFVEAPPSPVPLSRFPEGDQATVRAAADAMLAQVLGLAERLDAQGKQGSYAARALRDACNFPPEDLWVYRGAPLIVNWGYRRVDAASSGPATISVAIPAAPPQPPPAANVSVPISRPKPEPQPPILRARPPFGLIAAAALWVAFALMLGRLYFDLLPACGVRLLWTVGNCPAAATASAEREGLWLQRAVEQAELELARKKRFCARRASLDAAPKLQLALAQPHIPSISR